MGQTVSGLANDKDWDIHRVADRVNGIAEDQIFKTAVAVSAHDDQIGGNLAGIPGDFAAGSSAVANGGFHVYLPLAQRLDEFIQIAAPGFHLRRGGVLAEDLAGDAFLDVKQEKPGPIGTGKRSG